MTMSSGWIQVEMEREVRAGLYSGTEAIPLEGVSRDERDVAELAAGLI